MNPQPSDGPPMLQRIYNRIWVIAIVATLFFLVTYVGWGVIDILSAPPR